MKPTLYHNPRCSKSRQAKALLQEKGIEFDEILYLKAELSAEDYLGLLNALGGQPIEHLRKGEAGFKTLTDLDDLAAVARALSADPILLERPVLRTEQGAWVCRPPERIHDVL